MSKIQKAFANDKVLVTYLTAGEPSLEKTEEYILRLAEAGSGLIEIGIPFSDPVAEGEVIERANNRSLARGTTTDKIFDMVKKVRLKSQAPLVFLTYMNPVFVYGTERFLQKCQECGVNGLIIPDLPFEEKEEVAGVASRYDVDLISIIAPNSKDRVQTLAKDAAGFIYLVSSMGVTGVRNEIQTDLASIIRDIRQVSAAPVAVGFGVSTEEQAQKLAKDADGVIIGSAIMQIIEQYGENAGDRLAVYVQKIKRSMLS